MIHKSISPLPLKKTAMKTNANILGATVSILLLLGAPMRAAETAQPSERPNVVVMIADDLGSGDVGCLFRKTVRTPNIDRLASQGVTFSSGYVTASICAPSRAGFYSGKYQQRFGFCGNHDRFPKEVELMPATFKKAGYSTCLLGKWHSAFADPTTGPAEERNRPDHGNPRERGFDEFYGMYGATHDYHQPKMDENGKKSVLNEYTTDYFARRAEEYIDKNKANPFLLTVAFNAPHIGQVVQNAGKIHKKWLEAFEKGEVYDVPKSPTARPGDAQKYATEFPGDTARADTVATIVALDQAVGRILDKLEQCGLSKKTIVFFFSDNGGHSENRSENLPLRGYKFELFDGGLRVPFFGMYPGKFPAGLDYKSPVSAMDIFPTCAALAGVTTPGDLDGVNLLSHLLGENKNPPHSTLYWLGRTDWLAAIRQGDWKYVFAAASKGGTGKLFNLAEDPLEKVDVADKNPAIVAQLDQAWRQWRATLPTAQNSTGAKGNANEE